jgi:hypothetical protein
MAFALTPELPIVDWLAEFDGIAVVQAWLNRELMVTVMD